MGNKAAETARHSDVHESTRIETIKVIHWHKEILRGPFCAYLKGSCTGDNNAYLRPAGFHRLRKLCPHHVVAIRKLSGLEAYLGPSHGNDAKGALRDEENSKWIHIEADGTGFQ